MKYFTHPFLTHDFHSRLPPTNAILPKGTAVATIIPAEVESAVLSARELQPAQVHKGPIIAVEPWGVLIDLGGASGGGEFLCGPFCVCASRPSKAEELFSNGSPQIGRFFFPLKNTCYRSLSLIHMRLPFPSSSLSSSSRRMQAVRAAPARW